MRRLCLYLIADREGIVDEYIYFMLKRLKEDVTDIVIISNGPVLTAAQEWLSHYSSDIYIRPNEGFDAGGFKDTILNFLSFDKVREYDELVLINDSFFGPIDSFSHVFEYMDERTDIDFWSLTKNMGNMYLEPSMQTYFITFKKQVLHSEAFEEYWTELPYYTEFVDAVEKYEKYFAQFFVERGFVWDAYIDDSKYDCLYPREYCFSSYHSEQFELMYEQKYPIVKRKLFAFNAMEGDYGIERQGRENTVETLEYIDKHTNYDVNLIWKQILRSYDLRNIQDSCCLRYNLTYDNKNVEKNIKIALCIWHTGSEITFEMKRRLSFVAEKMDVFLLTNAEIQTDEFMKVNVVLLPSVLDKWTALAQIDEKLKGYEYIGVLTDNSCYASASEPYSVYGGASWTRWENMLGQYNYIDGVINLFKEHKSLGLLVTQKPVFAKYLSKGAFSEPIDTQPIVFWDIARVLQLNTKIRNGFLADYSDSFWCVADYLRDYIRSVSNLKNKAFVRDNSECFDKLLPYFLQMKGYYTATVESVKSASITETLCIDYLRDIVTENKKRCLFKTYPQMRCQNGNPIRNIDEIRTFIRTHKNIGIYGTGKIAKQLVIDNDIEDFSFFVVSDGQDKNSFCDKKVIWTSEIKSTAVDGIIMALSQKNTYAALMALGKADYDKDILYVLR